MVRTYRVHALPGEVLLHVRGAERDTLFRLSLDDAADLAGDLVNALRPRAPCPTVAALIEGLNR